MPPKHDSDATSGRKLLYLLQILLAEDRRHFLSSLAARLNCSKQTVLRLAQEIEGVLGDLIYTGIENRERWFQMKPRPRDLLNLDFNELRYLRLCRELLLPCLTPQAAAALDESLFKFALFMAETDLSQQDKGQFAFFSKGRIDYTAQRQNIASLIEAQAGRRVCRVEYQALGSHEPRLHNFVPSRLISMNQALYALGADTDADMQELLYPVNLAVHRIRSLTITNVSVDFALPDGDPGTFGLPWHEPVAHRIHFRAGKAADYVRERVWAAHQEMIELPDGSLELRITTRSTPELMAWVRSFGEEATLLPADKPAAKDPSDEE